MIIHQVTQTLIGQWVTRFSPLGLQRTRAHLVESEIAERIVTRCGREMPLEANLGSLAVTEPLKAACRQCAG